MFKVIRNTSIAATVWQLTCMIYSLAAAKVGKRLCLSIILIVATAECLLYAQMSIGDADVYFDFNTLNDNTGRYALLPSNPDGIPNLRIDKTQKGDQGDGMSYQFDGKEWLTFTELTPLVPAQEGTVAIRFYPEGTGGMLHTDRMSVLLHDSGLLLVIVALHDEKGTFYREMPFGFVSLNTWHDLIIRYEREQLEVVLDGVRLGNAWLGAKISSINSGSAFVGKWWLQRMPLETFPQHVVEKLFEKKFSGRIDHIAIWRKRLTDERAAALCARSTLVEPVQTEVTRALDAYREFHLASRASDTVRTVALGRTMREVMAADGRRPVYHLTAPLDAILDPAGAFYYKGRYHVFSYRNMSSLLAATPLVHYISDDLIHWKDFPVAVSADNENDVFGIWLGNMLVHNNIPYMLYTGLGQNGKFGLLARGDSNLITFSEKRVVISGMVHHDGHAWKDGNQWYALTTRQYWGSRDDAKGDAILLLSSDDLERWVVQGEIFQTTKVTPGADDNQRRGFTEYPYLIPFGNKYVLMTGTRPSKYWIGRFDPAIPAFIPEHPEGKLLDHLNTFHCFNPLTVDDKGPGASPRRIVEAMHLYASGKANGIPWYGVHTIPRVLTLKGDRLVQQPVEELISIRGKHEHLNTRNIGHKKKETVVTGEAVEVVAKFKRKAARRFGLKIGGDSSGENAVTIYFDARQNLFGVEGDFKKPANYPELGYCDSHLAADEEVSIRVLLDHSFFEVFVNGETFTGVFNGDRKRDAIRVFAEGGRARLVSLDLWHLAPAMVPNH